MRPCAVAWPCVCVVIHTIQHHTLHRCEEESPGVVLLGCFNGLGDIASVLEKQGMRSATEALGCSDWCTAKDRAADCDTVLIRCV